MSAILVLLSIYIFTKVSLSPDIILCGWLGSKYQLTFWTARARARTHTHAWARVPPDVKTAAIAEAAAQTATKARSKGVQQSPRYMEPIVYPHFPGKPIRNPSPWTEMLLFHFPTIPSPSMRHTAGGNAYAFLETAQNCPRSSCSREFLSYTRYHFPLLRSESLWSCYRSPVLLRFWRQPHGFSLRPDHSG